MQWQRSSISNESNYLWEYRQVVVVHRGGGAGGAEGPSPPPPNVNGSIKQKHTSENVQLLLHSPQNYEVSSYEVSTVRCTVQKSKV